MINTYSISGDTLNGVANNYALQKEISASSIITALDYITTSGDDLTITFKFALIPADKITLDGLVANHDGAALSEPDKIEVTNTIKQSGVNDPDGKRARLLGMASATIPPDSIVDLDWEMTQLQYKGADVYSIFNGIEYYARGAHNFDTVTLQVVDKEGFGVLAGWYDQATFNALGEYVAEEFGTEWFIMPDAPVELILYRSAIVPGLYLRLKYKNTHATNSVDFSVNLFRHLLE